MDHSLADILIAWFPMLLFVGVWLFFIRRSVRSPLAGAQLAYLKDHLEETKRLNAAMARIADALERLDQGSRTPVLSAVTVEE